MTVSAQNECACLFRHSSGLMPCLWCSSSKAKRQSSSSAKSTANSLSVFVTERSAPSAHRYSTKSTFPQQAAACSGVQPKENELHS